MKYLTLQQAAQDAGLHVSTLRKRCQRGGVPGAMKAVFGDPPRLVWLVPEDALGPLKQPRRRGAPKGALRSPTRKLINRLMLKGHKLTMQEICQQVGCSHQLARKYLKEIGAVRSPQTKWWSIPSSTD